MSDVFLFGKHKSKSFEEVSKSDPGYCKWTLGLEETKGQLGEFKQYLQTLPSMTQLSQTPNKRMSSQPASQSSSKPEISLTVTLCPASIKRDKLHYGLRLDGFLPTEEWQRLNTTEGLSRGASSRDWIFPADHINEVISRVDYPVNMLPSWIIDLVGSTGVVPVKASPLYYSDFPELANSILPYQREGIQYALERKGKCLIGDEMGLGKTLQALVIAWEWNQTEWPLLVVCPSSIRFVWEDQIKKWLPGKLPSWSVQVIRKGSDVISQNSRVVIVGYPMISRPEFQKMPNGRSFQVLICDESHYIKEMNSKRTRAIIPLIKKAKRSILLSGTPALNNAEELYPQLTSLVTVKGPTLTEYRSRFCNHVTFRIPRTGAVVDKWSGCRNQDELHALLSSTVMIRRTKASVLTQLPSKVRHKVVLESIDTFDSREVKRLNEEWQSKNWELDMKLIMNLWRLTGTCKQPHAQEYIENLLENCTDKILVFSHHKAMQDALEERLKDIGVPYMRIDGSTPQAVRARNVEIFQTDPQCRVALLSITACAEGITLTAATLVVFCELYWSPGIMEQAEARAHRVGQASSVLVHFLVMPGSPDEFVFSLLEKKKKDTSAILDGLSLGLDCHDLKGTQDIIDIDDFVDLDDIGDIYDLQDISSPMMKIQRLE